MKAGLHKYKEMIANTELSTDQKVLSIQNEIEEAQRWNCLCWRKPRVPATIISRYPVGSVRYGCGYDPCVLCDVCCGCALIQISWLLVSLKPCTIQLWVSVLPSSVMRLITYTTDRWGINYSIGPKRILSLTQSFAATYK